MKSNSRQKKKRNTQSNWRKKLGKNHKCNFSAWTHGCAWWVSFYEYYQSVGNFCFFFLFRRRYLLSCFVCGCMVCRDTCLNVYAQYKNNKSSLSISHTHKYTPLGNGISRFYVSVSTWIWFTWCQKKIKKLRLLDGTSIQTHAVCTPHINTSSHAQSGRSMSSSISKFNSKRCAVVTGFYFQTTMTIRLPRR